MKKILILLIAFIIMLTPMSVFAIEERPEKDVEEKPTAEVICKTDKGSDKYMSWNLAIPQLKCLKNPKVEKSINKDICDCINDFKKKLHAEAKKAYKESKGSKHEFRPFEIQTTYKVHLLTNNVLSLTVDKYQFTGGAHGFTTKVAFNYDLKTGKRIGYEDIFKNCPNYKDIIVDEIIKQIKRNPEYYFDDAIDTVKNFDPDKQPFYITKKGIVVYYGLYEIAPYASGIREFLIPFSAFKHCKGN